MDKEQLINKMCQESSEAFIKRLTDSDDNYEDNTYDGYVIELEAISYDPWTIRTSN